MTGDSPEAESACYHVAGFETCPSDSSRRRNRDLCQLCFPDGTVPECVTHFVFSSQGNLLHRSVDQGGETDATDVGTPSEYWDVTSILKREDVTTIEDARRVAGGES